MTTQWKQWLRPLALTLPAFCGAAILVDAAHGQTAPSPPSAAKEDEKDKDKDKDQDKDAAKDAKDAAKDTSKDPKDTAKDVRDAAKDARDTTRDARDTVRDTRGEVRDTARDAKKDARDTIRDARHEGRDTIRDERGTVRDARENVRDTARDAVRDPRDPKDPVRDQSRDARDPESIRTPRADTRTDVRADRTDATAHFSAQGIRSADFGLWFDRGSKNGLVISDVANKGAIAKLGFQEGDRIVSVNGQRVATEQDFVTYLFDEQYRNDRIKVVVMRDGREEVIMVQPAVFVDELSYINNDPLEHFGVLLDDRNTNQLVVWRVIPRSPAYYAGIRAGDVLVSSGNTRFTNVGNLINMLTTGQGGVMQFQVGRGQQTRNITVDVPQFEARTARRTTLRPNFSAAERIDNATERRDDRIDRREERIDDRRERIEDRRDNPVIPRVPAPVAPAPGVNPPAVTPAPAPAPAPAPGAAPAPKNPSRPGLFPRR